MPYADVNRQRLFYTDSGGDGAAIIFSHGFLMDHTMFDPQVDALRGDFRCIAWDERGFGQTECDGQPFTYWDSADDCLGLLDHLGVERAVLAGMSQGGFLSMRAALAHPDRVGGLVLIDTESLAADPAGMEENQKMLHVWTTHGASPELLATVSQILLGEDKTVADTWQARWAAMPTTHFALATECLMGRDDITGRLGEIACPALIVHGDADMAIDIAQAHALDAGLPDSRGVVTVPGGGHAANLTHPDIVNPPILDFLRAITA